MIAQSRYLCGSNTPALATMVCTTKGCTAFAMTCGRQDCTCRSPHKNHHMLYLSDIMEILHQPFALPSHVTKLMESTDHMINGLIEALKRLQTGHRDHISQYTTKLKGENVLGTKLIQNKDLEAKQSTGDCFSKLLKEL
jgi:hypothetical protein